MDGKPSRYINKSKLMGKFVDLTGKQFGTLTVLRRADDYISPAGKHITQWLCHCSSCGQDKVMLRNVLTKAVSCGCLRNISITHDLSGKRFGRWTVIERRRLQKTDSGGAKNGWLCRCDCGTERILPARYLTSGSSTSCGCATAEKAKSRVDDDNILQRYDGTVISTIRPDRHKNSNNKSGVTGVYWSDREQRWIAKIGLRGKSITLGRFANLEDAVRARKYAEEEYYAPIIDEWENQKEKDNG